MFHKFCSFKGLPFKNPLILSQWKTGILESQKQKVKAFTFRRKKSPMEVYPKVRVKVRQEEDADQYALELSSLQSLRGFESLAPYGSSPDDSPTSIVRIPVSSISSLATSEDPVPKDDFSTSILRVPGSSFSSLATSNDPVSTGATSYKKHNEADGGKTNPRASLVSRPRAVLSSPDNDTMIGGTDKTRGERRSTLKNHNLSQNRHTQCKLMLTPIPEGPASKTREAKKSGYSENDLQIRGWSVTDDPSKRLRRPKGNPESLQSRTPSKLTRDK